MIELLRRIDLRNTDMDRRTLRTAVPRAHAGFSHAAGAAAGVLADVRERGREAVVDLTHRFDGVRLERVRVPEAELKKAYDDLPADVEAALREARARLERVSAGQLPADDTQTFAHGGTVTSRWQPVERVGLYVPGGLAAYPSTVLMNAVPALTAGVKSMAIASPPGPDGLPNRTVMAAAHLLGVTEVWAMGGAQAIGAFAYGFSDGEDLEPVDLITGPGNAFVAAAKAEVRDVVGIDAVAGPTEIIVVALSGSRPDFVAADLLSQAEHDPLAASVLVTDSEDFADAVDAALAEQTAKTPHRERVEQALRGEQSGTILVSSKDDAIAVANAYAGEHVEVHGDGAEEAARGIVNGGSVFIGDYSPVALGDYCSGSNHVLPTVGSAAFASALGTMSFMKGSQVISYSKEALEAVAGHISAFRRVEDLPAHGAAVQIRLEG